MNIATNPAENPEPPQNTQNAEAEEAEAIAPLPEPKLPTRKDTSLREFLSKMDDYAPLVRRQLPYPHCFMATY